MNPEPNDSSGADDNNREDPAVNLIRTKIGNMYEDEPAASTELIDAKAAATHRSKHQQVMYDLANSGRSLAEIQTAWHNYYLELSDEEKHEVWQEFYDLHGQRSHYWRQQASGRRVPPKIISKLRSAAPRSVIEIKDRVLKTIASRSKITPKQHLKSLAFGLGVGALSVLILLFSFFNERFIAPLISPSRSVSSTPIIVDPGSVVAAGSEPTIIIPKINVEVPVVYDEPSVDEKAIQNALERGVVHYASTPQPGQQGNAVIVGHSSNNILNRGKYKFAFVLLNRLNNGDTFMIIKDGKRYIYQVYEKRIVKADDLSVLGASAKPASVTLITCDPPGTSINRLVIVGEQITPDPAANVASSAQTPPELPKILPSNAPSLWQRIKSWFTS